MNYKPVIAILGPTASGKSDLAQNVALALNGEVVSADSMQVYRGMDIGTAKVVISEQKVAHHLIDILDPGEPYSAQLFQRMARDCFKSLQEKEKVPVLCGSERCIDFPVKLDDRIFHTTAISLGNPHCVSFIDDVANFNLAKYGPLMEHHEIFPRRVNAEFCEVIDRNTLKLRTWERGTSETLACATGCSTCVVGGVLTDRCDRKADVHQIGGVTRIEWDAKTDNILMTAPSEMVFDGTVSLDSEVFKG